MTRGEGHARADEVARVQVELATAAAGATPLAELAATANDLSRVLPLLEQLAAAVASLLGTDLAVVWTTDPHEDVLLPSAWVGFPDDYIAPLRVPYGTGSAGRAIVERRTVLVEDIATSPRYGAFAQGAIAHGVHTVLSVPMLTLGGEPMGTLSTYYRELCAPDERDLELVEVYARQAAEIVERARLHAEARQLAALEQRRSTQLRALAHSALELSAADSLDRLLSLVTDAAVEVIGCHQGVTSRLRSGWEEATTYVTLSEQYAQWRDYDVVPKGLGVLNAVTRENRPLRLTPEELVRHPEWRGLRDAPGHPPLPDYMAAPLIGRDGSNLGLIQLSHKLDGTAFSAEDEAILVQLAQMASSTIERLEALEGERGARREAERAALLRGVLSEASAVFAESFDPKGIGAALVDLVVPRLGRLALLHVLDESRSLVLDACAADDPGLQQALQAFFGAAPVLLDVPYGPAAVLASGQPQVLAATTREMARAVTVTEEQAEKLERLLGSNCVCLPLTARGSTLGVLTLSRDEPYDEADVEHGLDLARRAALALDNATRYAFERDMAVSLQRSLLPRELAVRPGLSAAARYLPGARGSQVGGDWYDLLEVDGRLVLVVGDVVGRGVEAAALMGQLRATVRAYAIEGHGPADILTRLDRVVLSLTGLHFTTCVVGVLDPQARTLCLASAGHLPPLLACPAGAVTVVELDPGLPLGVGGGDFVEQTVELEPGSLVLLYTDGLVETRECSVDEGLEQLVAALAQPISSAEHACDLALGALDRGGSDDDTAVLALLLDPPEGVTELVVELPAVAASASVARTRLRALLEARGLETDVALLLLTELVGNTARHAAPGEITVRVLLAGALLRVEVADSSSRQPRLPTSTPWEQESGRGLLLVEALADRWGSTPVQGGKAVWFELAAQPEG
jgi:GAF domain-containing protein/anti-sigma regulatory factor (Ser/Thr protein kinase)